MRTIRGRLAGSYAVALAATMLVFAVVIYLVQRGENLAELDARARLESNLIAATLSEAYRARGRLVVEDPRGGQSVLAPGVSPFLEGLPGYVVVVAADGDVLHLSRDARALPYGSLVRLLAVVFGNEADSRSGVLDLGPPVGQLRYYVQPVSEAGPEVAVLSLCAIVLLVMETRAAPWREMPAPASPARLLTMTLLWMRI